MSLARLLARRRAARRPAGCAGSPPRWIRLRPSPAAAATTPFERLVTAMLRRDGGLPLATVVERIADALYREALRHGAWAADIGVLGPGAFAAEVVRELEARRGVLWTIEPADGGR